MAQDCRHALALYRRSRYMGSASARAYLITDEDGLAAAEREERNRRRAARTFYVMSAERGSAEAMNAAGEAFEQISNGYGREEDSSNRMNSNGYGRYSGTSREEEEEGGKEEDSLAKAVRCVAVTILSHYT